MKPMKPRLICLYICLCLGSALPFFLGANEPRQPHVMGPGESGSIGEPSSGSDCVGGCNAVKDTTDELTGKEIKELLAVVANGAAKRANHALETLLFHGRQVSSYVGERGADPLDTVQTQRLRAELAKTHTLISLRVIDSDGRVRMELCENVPVGIKQHLHPTSADGFTPPEVSFTVQRVGLRHLWTRI